MHTSLRITLSSLLCTVCLVVLQNAHAEGGGSIVIEQRNTNGDTLGEWTLKRPTKKSISSSIDDYTLGTLEAGRYSLFATPPVGGVTVIEMFVNGELKVTLERPQISFNLAENDEVVIVVTYTFTIIGGVSVQSDPTGIGFRLTGPNDSEWTDVTPFSLDVAPIGLYTVYYDKIEDCRETAPQSKRLEKDGRITISLTLSCEGADAMRDNEEEEKRLQFVSVITNGKTVIYEDVPLGKWFSEYIYTAIKSDIVSGDKDTNGNLIGRYRPENEVTLAELAKIAHAIASIKTDNVRGEPANQQAASTWFSKYIRSAEDLDWVVYRNSRLDLLRPATRAEVVVTFLQALDVPRYWPKGTMFTDVLRTSKYAASIETAAREGLISGHESTSGDFIKEFRPDNPLNRAEMAKIISKAIDIFVEDTPEFTGESY